MQYSNKFDNYVILSNKYIDTIEKLIDFSIIKNLLPIKILLGMTIFKNYLKENKTNLIQSGVEYLLNNKDYILNFDLDSLDELDTDSDDNISRKNYLNNINQMKNIINDNNFKDYEILNLIIDIKNNAKRLNETDKSIIKGYIEVLIMILENIKKIFI